MSEESQEFEKTKVRYFTRKTLAHLPEMRAAREAGLFPKKEGWRNVVEHMVVEAEAADVLAEAFNVPKKRRKALTTAAMLHDVYKRKEKEIVQEKGDEGFDQAENLQSQWLRERGYPEEIIELTESVAHGSLLKFQSLDEVSLTRKIIHYVDDITQNNDLVSLDQRIDAIEANPRYKELNERGSPIFPGKTYYQVQRETSKKIEQEFAQRLGLKDPTQLPFWIKERILERIVKK